MREPAIIESSSAQAPATPALSATRSTVSTLQITAILLMAAGWGWICGNFVQPVTYTWGIFADILHVLPLVALLLLSVRVLPARSPARGARIGITVIAILAILLCSVFVLLGALNPDPNSVGVHNFADWQPVIVLCAGAFAWLVAPLARRSAA